MGLFMEMTVATLLFFTLSEAVPPPGLKRARVLAYFGLSYQSHSHFYNALTTELAIRGHDVTVVTAYPLDNPPKENYRQVVVSTGRDLLDSVNVFKAVHGDFWERLERANATWELFNICTKIIHSPEVKNLRKENFDLVLVALGMNECAIPFARSNGAHLVLISPVSGTFHLDTGLGDPEPTSYVPSVVVPFNNHMNFLHRLANTLVAKSIQLLRLVLYWPIANKASRDFFGHETPPVQDLLRNASLLILNSHLRLNYPKPLEPAVVETGGMHIKKIVEPLPEDLQEFLDGADHGAIYFSMGTLINSKDMPEEKIAALVGAFAELPQRVIWKWEADSLPGQPKNVKTGKFLPQQSILAHPNLKLFITPCGSLSTQEAAYYGIPVIAIPVMGHHWQNALTLEDMGCAKHISFDSISKKSFLRTMIQVLNEPSFMEKAKQLQAQMLDQPQTPLEKAVYWTEYVIRHNGAAHLRSAAVDLSWYQLHLIDVYLAIGAFIISPLLLFYFIIKILCCGKSKKKEASAMQSKKKN